MRHINGKPSTVLRCVLCVCVCTQLGNKMFRKINMKRINKLNKADEMRKWKKNVTKGVEKMVAAEHINRLHEKNAFGRKNRKCINIQSVRAYLCDFSKSTATVSSRRYKKKAFRLLSVDFWFTIYCVLLCKETVGYNMKIHGSFIELLVFRLMKKIAWQTNDHR